MRFSTPESYTPRHLGERILASRDSLVGERKQVTVLFADIVGSTELIRDRDPEEAQQLLDGVVQLMMDAIHRYEGTVSRLMGDGLMAMFGAPIAHEDHAVRACYAALALLDATRRHAEGLRRIHGVAVSVRVGISSGEVVVRTIRDDLHMDYTAMGQTVHLSARMEGLARPETAVMTAETLALVEGYVQVRALGPVPVKGLAGPVEVYQLVGAGQARTRLQVSAARGLTRFVGRDSEMTALYRALERASAGHGQLAALVGEPGVGKSRLVWEMTHSHRTQGWLVLESGSVSYGKATSYLPIIDLLKVYCRIEAADDSRAIREKVTGKLLALDRALESCLPPLLALLDVPSEDAVWEALDPVQRRRQTLDAVLRMVLRESQTQPLLLVFEDLHWIDSETQALLDGMTESLPTARILLLVNYRPEYAHGWGSKTFYTQVRVDPLGEASADELLAGLLGDDPSLEPLTTLLAARTEGNPLFLEESVRSLVETGALVGERGAYQLPIPVATLRVPPTVQAVLAARIDRLPPAEKLLLQTAAVIGKDVPDVLLRAVADCTDDDLLRGLAHLQAAEFMHQARLFPELEYTFKHALTHEVAYGSLLQERRLTLHARIVEAMERLYAVRLEEHVERLAHHAGHGQIWDKAVAYCRQASARSRMRSAYREAVSWFDEALRALGHLPASRETLEIAIDLRLDVRGALGHVGAREQLLVFLRETEEIATSLGDERRRGRIYAAIADCLRSAGDYEQATETNQRALELARAVKDEPLAVICSYQNGLVSRDQGLLHQTIEALRSCIGPMESLSADERHRLGLTAVSVPLARAYLAWSLAELGQFDEAIALGRETIRIGEQTGDVFAVSVLSNMTGRFVLDRGDVEQAIPLIERGRDLAQTHQLPNPYIWSSAELGVAHVLRGQRSIGVSTIEEAVARSASTGIVQGYALWQTWLGEAYLVTGRLDEADVAAQTALDYAVEHHELHHQAYALRLHADIAASAKSSKTAQAEALYREALALAHKLGMRPLQAHCHFGLGRLYRRIGRLDEAHSELSMAVSMLREMGMTFWLPEAERELALLVAR